MSKFKLLHYVTNRTATQYSNLLLALIAIAVGLFAGVISNFIESPLVAVIGLIGLIAMLVTVSNVEGGLVVLIFMVFTRLSDVLVHEHGAPSIFQPFMLLLLAVVGARAAFFNNPPEDMWATIKMVGLYTLMLYASLLYAKDTDLALEALLDFIKDVIVMLVIVSILKRADDLQHICWAFIIAGAFLGTISIYQQITGTYDNIYWGFGLAHQQHIIGEQNDYRIAGPIGDPNFYAQIMLIPIPLAMDRIWQEKRVWLRALAGWGFVVSILTVVFTFSRGAFIALMVMLLILLIRRRPNPGAIIAIIALAIPMLQFVPEDYTARLKTVTALLPSPGDEDNGAEGETSFRGRLSETTVAIMMFVDHPFVGVGMQNYPIYYISYSSQLGLDSRLENRSAHSLYLQIAAETGLMGIIMFGGIVGYIFYHLRRGERVFNELGMPHHANMINAFSISVAGYLMAATFLHGAYPRYMWLLFGIAFSIPNIVSWERRKKEQLTQ